MDAGLFVTSFASWYEDSRSRFSVHRVDGPAKADRSWIFIYQNKVFSPCIRWQRGVEKTICPFLFLMILRFELLSNGYFSTLELLLVLLAERMWRESSESSAPTFSGFKCSQAAENLHWRYWWDPQRTTMSSEGLEFRSLGTIEQSRTLEWLIGESPTTKVSR